MVGQACRLSEGSIIMKFKEMPTIIYDRWRDKPFRNKALPVMVLVVFTVLIIPNLLWKQSAQKDLSTVTAKYREYSALTGEYRSLKENVDVMEQRKSLTKTNSIAQAMEDITLPLGIKGKMKSIKGTGTKKIVDQMTEESAEIQMEKLNMSELIHLFHKIDNALMILSLKKVVIKKSFENADLLDLTMSVSLFTGAPAP